MSEYSQKMERIGKEKDLLYKMSETADLSHKTY